eukprot:16450718-Heterocapsa_arctica.AAC.1
MCARGMRSCTACVRAPRELSIYSRHDARGPTSTPRRHLVFGARALGKNSAALLEVEPRGPMPMKGVPPSCGTPLDS